MNKDFVEDNWKALVALALGLGVGALIAKSLLDSESNDDDERGFKKRDFDCLKLPKSALERYHRENCKTLVLDFFENGSGRVILKLKGYNWLGIRKVNIPLHVEQQGCYSSDNPLRGEFKHSDSDVPLHDLIASDPASFRDWWLKPVQCDRDPKLVSYILDDQKSLLARYKLNPSPPY